jgi:hypothetical protein
MSFRHFVAEDWEHRGMVAASVTFVRYATRDARPRHLSPRVFQGSRKARPLANGSDACGIGDVIRGHRSATAELRRASSADTESVGDVEVTENPTLARFGSAHTNQDRTKWTTSSICPLRFCPLLFCRT